MSVLCKKSCWSSFNCSFNRWVGVPAISWIINLREVNPQFVNAEVPVSRMPSYLFIDSAISYFFFCWICQLLVRSSSPLEPFFLDYKFGHEWGNFLVWLIEIIRTLHSFAGSSISQQTFGDYCTFFFRDSMWRSYHIKYHRSFTPSIYQLPFLSVFTYLIIIEIGEKVLGFSHPELMLNN